MGVAVGLLSALPSLQLAPGNHLRLQGWVGCQPQARGAPVVDEGLKVPCRRRKKPLRGIGVQLDAFLPNPPNVVWVLTKLATCGA